MHVREGELQKLLSVMSVVINDDLKAEEKAGNISEDELRNLTDDVQKLTDKFIAQVDSLCDDKEKDILEV